MEGEGKQWYVRNVPRADNPFPLGAGCCAEPTSRGDVAGGCFCEAKWRMPGRPITPGAGLGRALPEEEGRPGQGHGQALPKMPRHPSPWPPPGLMAVGGCWVLGLASVPVAGTQRGQAAIIRFGGLEAKGAGREPCLQPVGTALGKKRCQ